MTAEAGVVNRTGIALAADSAVTIGSEASKIYTSADKLFQLSHRAPVGIMVYGSASYLGVPWEVAVKTFRRELGDDTYDTLEGYADSFIDFLGRHKGLFPTKLQNQHFRQLASGFLVYLRRQAADHLTKVSEAQDGLDEDEIGPLLEQFARKSLDVVRSHRLLRSLGPSARERIRKQWSGAIGGIRNEVFGSLPLTNSTKRSLTTLVVEMAARHYFGSAQAGVVVGGYGESEYFPSILSYEIEGAVLGRPRIHQASATHIGQDVDAEIKAYAQQEMVHTFLAGVEPTLESFMQSSTSEVFRGTVEAIIRVVEKTDPDLSQKLRAAIQPQVPQLLSDLFDQWRDGKRQLWEPVVGLAASLPKDELAAMAEALVNLTKFRRRVSPDLETVGGPIDVAVITKGDGFVWVKRKHYFEPRLNPRIMKRF